MSDHEERNKKHRKEIEDKIIGKRLLSICWHDRPDFDDEVLALKFDGATLQLYATDHGNIVWCEVEDSL